MQCIHAHTSRLLVVGGLLFHFQHNFQLMKFTYSLNYCNNNFIALYIHNWAPDILAFRIDSVSIIYIHILTNMRNSFGLGFLE